MTSRHVAEQVFGWLGTILWCIQLFPQVWLNFRRKTTQGLSPFLFICWMVSGASLGIYAIVENISIPIIVQPHCYGGLCAFIICQILHYDRKWKWYAAYIGGFSTYAVVCAGFEVGMVYACRFGEHHGHPGGTMFFGILSDIALGAGFLPQFYEIYKLKEVVGISYLFLFLDSLGAVFSILSLAFKTGEGIDIIALIGYVVIIAFEAAVGIVALFLNPRARRRREQETSRSPLRTDTLDGATLSSRGPSPARGANDKAERVQTDEEKAEGDGAREQVLPQVLPPQEEREIAEKVESVVAPSRA
ncbi:hypothetical protein JCM10207_008137 [Rhodosporidiobolus poonsookiae]